MKELERDIRRNANVIMNEGNEEFEADFLAACEEADSKEQPKTKVQIVEEIVSKYNEEIVAKTVGCFSSVEVKERTLEMFRNKEIERLAKRLNKDDLLWILNELMWVEVLTEETAATEETPATEETNKIVEVVNNMDYIKCSEVELNALHNLVVAIENVESAQAVESDVKHDLEVTNDHDLNGLAYDIKNNEIYENFIKFNKGETKVTAYDSCNGTGAQIIEIIYGSSEKVFGYYEKDGGKIFFISEIQENWIDNFETQDNLFLVEETKVCLSECMKINTNYEYAFPKENN